MPLRRLGQIRKVRFDLNSPRMAEALRNLGLRPQDVNTTLTINDFYDNDERIQSLRHNHYRQKNFETVN